MAWQYHPLLIVFALGGLVSLVVAGYCLRHVQKYGWSYLVAGIGLLGFNNAVWVFAATLKTASTDLQASLLFYKLFSLVVVGWFFHWYLLIRPVQPISLPASSPNWERTAQFIMDYNKGWR